MLASLTATAFSESKLCFGFDETAFDRGFKDGGFVAFEVGLDALEIGDGFVQTGELLFDLRDDVFLKVKRRLRKFRVFKFTFSDMR